jgi:hypothetical protein
MAYSNGLTFEVQNGGSDTLNSGAFRAASTLSAPAAPTVSATAGGGVTLGTYYVVITYIDAEGESSSSSESSVTSGVGHQTVQVNAPTDVGTPAGIIYWNVYIGTVSGGPYYWQGCVSITVSTQTFGSTPATSGFQAPGIDRSQQTSPQYTGTNLTVDGTTNTQVIPDGHTPVTADTGNSIIIKSGTGFTVGVYEITGFTTTGRWILDRSPAAVSTAGGVWALGGCLATPGQAAAYMNSQGGQYNSAFIKYSATPWSFSNSANVAGGWLSQPPGSWHGYATTRKRYNTDANRPQFNASVNSMTLVSTNNDFVYSNIIVDGNGHTGIIGFKWASRGYMVNCKANACSTGFDSNNALNTTTELVNCEATAFTSYGFNNEGNSDTIFAYCNVRTSTASANGFYNLTNGCVCTHCISYSSANGFSAFELTGGAVYFDSCVAYQGGLNTTGNGFLSSSNRGTVWVNCIAYGFQYNFNNETIEGAMFNCAAGNTGGANVYTGSGVISFFPHGQSYVSGAPGFIPLTGDPFVSASTGNFDLNNNSGAGALLRSVGYPSTFGTTLTTNYPDIGAAQHQASSGGVVPSPVGVNSSFIQGVPVRT